MSRVKKVKPFLNDQRTDVTLILGSVSASGYLETRSTSPSGRCLAFIRDKELTAQHDYYEPFSTEEL